MLRHIIVVIGLLATSASADLNDKCPKTMEAVGLQLSRPSDHNVEKFIDDQMAALTFPLGTVGDVNEKEIKGEAAQQFKVWANSEGNPQIHAINNNGQALWAIVGMGEDAELSGNFTSYIAIFSAEDGKLLAKGSCPPRPIQWKSQLSIGPIPAPVPYVPKLEPVTPSQTVDFFIEQFQAEFDEELIKSGTYSGTDAAEEPLKMKWNQQSSPKGKSLSVRLLKGNKAIASFELNPSSQIQKTNYSQYNSQKEGGSEGNYLVVQTKGPNGDLSTFWLHAAEGHTRIRIGTGQKIFEFNFNANK